MLEVISNFTAKDWIGIGLAIVVAFLWFTKKGGNNPTPGDKGGGFLGGGS